MTPLCHIDEIEEGKTRGFELGDLKLFALKKNGAIYLYENRCPHLGLNLEFQPDDFLNYDETYIQCSTHGAMFALETGECVLGPCKGDTLKDIPFELDDGQILAKVG
ncbi:MAG: Rieske (2Fe-2S) protein [Pseudomonadales bacterium]|jgi:nitrite reductase/ring-hydroxylating ferredoxin subunit